MFAKCSSSSSSLFLFAPKKQPMNKSKIDLHYNMHKKIVYGYRACVLTSKVKKGKAHKQKKINSVKRIQTPPVANQESILLNQGGSARRW